MDSLAHLSGFILNITCKQNEAYISEGWKGMRVLNDLSEAVTYISYVRMRPGEKPATMIDSVYVLGDSEIEAVFSGVRFRLVKKKTLDQILAFQGGKTLEPANSMFSTPGAQTPSERLSYSDSLMALVCNCLAEETGVERGDITENTSLADLGVDSLITITLLRRLRDYCDVSITPVDFVGLSNVGDMFWHAGNLAMQAGTANMQSLMSRSLDVPKSVQQTTHDIDATSAGDQILSMRPGSSDLLTLSQIIAEEFDLDIGETGPSDELLELGVDSINTMSVLHSFASKTGRTLPSSLFL